MNLDPSAFGPEQTSNHELVANISESALQLISALRIQREADIEETLLYIDTEDDTFTIPSFLKRNIAADSEIVELVIDTTLNRLTSKSEISLRISVAGTQNMLVNIISGGESDDPTTTLMIDDTELPCIEPPTRIELNRYLAGLFAINKTGDYSAFDQMDLSNIHTSERLVEALRDVASDSFVNEKYYLSDTLSPTASSIQYMEYNAIPQSATISIEHHAKASAIELSYTAQDVGDIDEDEDLEFIMQKLEGARTYRQDVDGISKQVPSTSEFLLVVSDFITSQKETVFTPVAEPLGDRDIADASVDWNIEDRKTKD
jgi:hypothetical protein